MKGHLKGIVTMANREFRKGKFRFNIFTRVLAMIYLISLVIFEFSIIILDVLPPVLLLISFVILGILSTIIFVQLFFKRIKPWAKRSATVISMLLICIFFLCSSYALKTLSFLGGISDGSNRDAVNVTRKPFTVLITGMDTWGDIDNKDGRSDVNMLVTVNPKTSKILLTSIPRDYEVTMPKKDGATDKLTHTGFYGVDDTIASIEKLLDIDINYYVKVNFSTVVKFIDAIGGLDVNSEYEFTATTYSPHEGTKEYYIKEGMNHMTGAEALAFARDRSSFAGGDNQRVLDQQRVVEAMIKKGMSSKTAITRYGSLLGGMKSYIRMNFKSGEIRRLLKYQITKKPKWEISKYALTGFDEHMGTYTTGEQAVYVMAQDPESIKKAHNKIYKTLGLETEEKEKE